jgi:hypothetical protein
VVWQLQPPAGAVAGLGILNLPAAQMQAIKAKRNALCAIVVIELRAEHRKISVSAALMTFAAALEQICCSSCLLSNVSNVAGHKSLPNAKKMYVRACTGIACSECFSDSS